MWYVLEVSKLLKRSGVSILVVFFFIGLLVSVHTELDYAQKLPGTPQAETGRVIRMTVNHGSVIYATHKEWEHYHHVEALSTCVMLISFIGLGIFKLSFKNAWN